MDIEAIAIACEIVEYMPHGVAHARPIASEVLLETFFHCFTQRHSNRLIFPGFFHIYHLEANLLITEDDMSEELLEDLQDIFAQINLDWPILAVFYRLKQLVLLIKYLFFERIEHVD